MIDFLYDLFKGEEYRKGESAFTNIHHYFWQNLPERTLLGYDKREKDGENSLTYKQLELLLAAKNELNRLLSS